MLPSEFIEQMKGRNKQVAYLSDEIKGFSRKPARIVYLLRTVVTQDCDPSSYQEVPVFFSSYRDADDFNLSIRKFSSEYAVEGLEAELRAVTFHVTKKPSDFYKIYREGLIALSDGTIMHIPFLSPEAHKWGFHLPADRIPKTEIKRFVLPEEELERLVAEKEYRSWNEKRHDELVMQWSIYPIACSINNK